LKASLLFVAAALSAGSAGKQPPSSEGLAGTSDAISTSAYTYVHHPVSTDSRMAQFFFDRGLTMFFAYQPEEAEVAFREAARLDPSLAMAWWGVGLAIGPNINEQPTPEKTAKAAEALARASLLAKSRATEAELDYVNALSARYTSAASPDFDELATRYRDGMRAVVKKYPSDADARALFAEAIMDLHPWRLWHASGGPEVGTEELVATLEQGLAAEPNHIGLLHFYIHAVEASSNPGRALEVAHRLSALPMEPAAAHLVHMPAHIYMRVGDWASAASIPTRLITRSTIASVTTPRPNAPVGTARTFSRTLT
jgi:hypothetical protein